MAFQPSGPIAIQLPTRDFRIDAAKGVLILLVVVGHLLEVTNYWGAKSIRLPLTSIYMFHMPAFVFLAGATAKTNRLGHRIGHLLILLLTFQALYLVDNALTGETRTTSYFPFWTLWFLIAMIWWLMLLPLIRRYPRAAMAISVLVSIGIGAVSGVGNDLGLSRTLVFMPFFTAGALFGNRILSTATRAPVLIKGTILVAAMATVWLVFEADLSPWLLFGNLSFGGLHVSLARGLIVRTLLLLSAALMTFGLLSLMPRRPTRLAVVGGRSLAIYLLHGFVIMSVTALMPQFLQNLGSAAAVASCLLIGMLIVSSLSLPVFERLVRSYSETVVKIVFKLIRSLRLFAVRTQGSKSRS